MWFFKKRQQEDVQTLPHRDVGASIEIIAGKEATREMANKAKAANEQLNGLLVGNGFTLKIYLAAGGSHHKAQSGTK